MLIGGGAPHVRWKRGIDRLVPPCREVGLQMGIDRARVGQHERRDVVGFIIVQHSGRVARANRHVLPEEAGRRQQPVHAGTVVEAVRPPQRGEGVALASIIAGSIDYRGSMTRS